MKWFRSFRIPEGEEQMWAFKTLDGIHSHLFDWVELIAAEKPAVSDNDFGTPRDIMVSIARLKDGHRPTRDDIRRHSQVVISTDCQPEAISCNEIVEAIVIYID